MNIESLNRRGITYITKPGKYKKMSMSFTKNGVLTIKYPLTIKQNLVIEFIDKNINWVEKNFLQNYQPPRHYNTFEKYLFLGREYTITTICGNKPQVVLNKQEMIIYTKNDTFIEKQKIINKWLTLQSELVFQEVLNYCFEQIKTDLPNVLYPKLQIKKYKSRWGCCYPQKRLIILNIRLIHVPLDLIKYVVFHELSHFAYLNHSPQFHSFLRKYVPNEKALKKVLQGYNPQYDEYARK